MSTPASAHDLQTEPLQPTEEQPVLDALALVGYRTRSQAIPDGLASPGDYLALQDGDETLLIALEGTSTRIGRGVGADIRFDDQHVSRDHAVVVRDGRHVRVLDNRSANGTFVNGRRIVGSRLRDGDDITIGRLTVQYVKVA